METYLITAIVTLASVVTALSAAIVHLWRNQLTSTSATICKLEARIAVLESREQELEQKLDELEKENHRLRTQYLVLATSHGSSPLPMWIKDTNGIVLQANKAYERLYLKPLGKTLQDYIGHRDSEVWPERVVKVFEENDKKVLETRDVLDVIEPVTNGDGVDVPTRVIKYPRFASGIDEPFGISGVAIPEELS